jgi:hypothetical protein
MRNDFESNYLAHHGVPDQRWGVRNGPPYPLHSDKLAAKLYKEASKKEPKIFRRQQLKLEVKCMA